MSAELVPADPVVYQPPADLAAMTLAELGEAATTAAEESRRHLGAAIDRLIRLGEVFMVARPKLETDKAWNLWCRDVADMSKTRASNAMRLAYYRDHLPIDSGQS